MKVSGDKCHLMFFSNVKNISITQKIDNELIIESPEEYLLGVILHETLSFKAHITSLCKSASKKLHVLSSIAYYMNSEKLENVMRPFILS